MFIIWPPAPSLRRFVLGYWFVQDLAGRYRGMPIQTVPHPAAVLTINVGQPNADGAGKPVPPGSLLGLQTCVRTWLSGPDMYFVMIMLNVRGLISLFPYSGADTINNLVDLGSLLGDAQSRRVIADVSAAWDFQLVAGQLNRWLDRLFAAAKPPAEALRFSAACEVLAQHCRVELAAAEIGISRRQFGRWSRALIGMGPKEFAQLQRLQASVTSVQAGTGDPVAGFSDQAHQIREWR